MADIYEQLTVYADVQPRQQEEIRNEVFAALTAIRQRLTLVYQRADAEMARLQQLQQFVTIDAISDFTAPERQQLAAERTAIRQIVQDHAAQYPVS